MWKKKKKNWLEEPDQQQLLSKAKKIQATKGKFETAANVRR